MTNETPVLEVSPVTHFSMPWNLCMAMFKLHLQNKLIQTKSFTPDEAVELVLKHQFQYHPLLDELMKQMIKENSLPFLKQEVEVRLHNETKWYKGICVRPRKLEVTIPDYELHEGSGETTEFVADETNIAEWRPITLSKNQDVIKTDITRGFIISDLKQYDDLPDKTYLGSVTGNLARFVYNNKSYWVKLSNCVQGIERPITITFENHRPIKIETMVIPLQ